MTTPTLNDQFPLDQFDQFGLSVRGSLVNTFNLDQFDQFGLIVTNNPAIGGVVFNATRMFMIF